MYQEIQNEVLEVAVKAYREKLMAGTSGNFSAFDEGNKIMAITPSGMEYNELKTEDISVLDLEGNQIAGEYKPSSEWRMHLEMYKKMPNIKGIAHTHSPYATSFAVINEPIEVILIEMALLGGRIPVAPFALPGSTKLGENIAETMIKNKVYGCLMQSHGAIATGNTLGKALMNAVYLEDAAKIYHYAKDIGTPVIIDESYVNTMKKNFGIE